MNRISHLQKQVLASCTECEGTGLIKDPFKDSICRRCGGFGLTENEGEICEGRGSRRVSMNTARTT